MPNAKAELIIGDRGSGKTTALMKWVLEGERRPGYPGWSRVLVVPFRQREEYMRNRAAHFTDLPWEEIDWAHRIYTWEDWSHAMAVDPRTEVRIDGIEGILPRLPGTLTGFSFDTPAEVVVLHRPVDEDQA